MDHPFDSFVFRACFLSSGKEGLSMKFFMELLSSLTIRGILAIAQLLTTSLDCILKIIELRKKVPQRIPKQTGTYLSTTSRIRDSV